jgi:hypothetical protein
MKKDVATLLDDFDKGFFVRKVGTAGFVWTDWDVKLLPYLLAMARLTKAVLPPLPKKRKGRKK